MPNKRRTLGRAQPAPPERRLHARRAVAIARAGFDDGAVETELTIPESEHAIDMVALVASPRAAWGAIAADLADRPVLIEHFARPPSPKELASAWFKLGWARLAWAGGRWRTKRPPLLLVLSCGRPQAALQVFRELDPDPCEPSISRTLPGHTVAAVLVDVKNLRDRPGHRFLRAFDHRPAAALANLRRLHSDRHADTLTWDRLSEAIVSNKTLFDPSLYELSYEELLARGIERGREEGREEGLERGIERGREEGREAMLAIARIALDEVSCAELAAIEDLETLRDRLAERLASR